MWIRVRWEYRSVMEMSLWPIISFASFRLAPESNRLKQKVCRRSWKWKSLIPASSRAVHQGLGDLVFRHVVLVSMPVFDGPLQASLGFAAEAYVNVVRVLTDRLAQNPWYPYLPPLPAFSPKLLILGLIIQEVFDRYGQNGKSLWFFTQAGLKHVLEKGIYGEAIIELLRNVHYFFTFAVQSVMVP